MSSVTANLSSDSEPGRAGGQPLPGGGNATPESRPGSGACNRAGAAPACGCRARQHATCLGVILAVWAVTHLFSLSWGLPNRTGIEPDGVPMNAFDSALDMMRNNIKYPPLQYLLWEGVFPTPVATRLSYDEGVGLCSARIWRYRLVVACQSLLSAVVVYGLARSWLGLGAWSVAAALLFLLNPMSLYYSHTTNMDQPYLLWLLLASLLLAVADRDAPSPAALDSTRPEPVPGSAPGPTPGQRHAAWRRPLVLNLLVGGCLAAAFCTKDQAYAYVLLPLTGYLLQCGLRREGWHGAARRLLGWAAGFAVVTTGVYGLGSGWRFLAVHVSWITGQGKDPYAQAPATLSGLLALAGRSLNDLFTGLDTTLLALAVVALFTYARYRCISSAGRRALEGCCLTYASFLLAYVCVCRFTYARFYLPLVPLVALFCAWALATLWRRFSRRLFLVLVVLVAAMASLQAAQMLWNLTRDPRTLLRSRLATRLEARDGKRPRIALDGSSFDREYLIVDHTTVPMRAIRNWSYSSFGTSLRQVHSIIVQPLFLGLTAPDVVVVGSPDAAKRLLLRDQGFVLAETIPPPRQFFACLFASPLPFPCFDLYVRAQPARRPVGREDIRDCFEDQLLVLQACVKLWDSQQALRAFGQLAADFAPPDLGRWHLDLDTIALAALAYEANGRGAAARQAYAFLCSQAREPTKYAKLAEALGVPGPGAVIPP